MALRNRQPDPVGDDDGIVVSDLTVEPDFFARDLTTDAPEAPTVPEERHEEVPPPNPPEKLELSEIDDPLEELAGVFDADGLPPSHPDWDPTRPPRRVVEVPEALKPRPRVAMDWEDVDQPAPVADTTASSWRDRVSRSTAVTALAVAGIVTGISFSLIPGLEIVGGKDKGARTDTWRPTPASAPSTPQPPASSARQPGATDAPTNKPKKKPKKKRDREISPLQPSTSTQASPSVPRYRPAPSSSAASKEFGL